jgi:anaerobic magnesium-protoporphyrin IX monomethyl ester cyclase
VVEVAGRWLPLNLLYLSTAAKRAGYETSLHDAMSRFDELDEIVARVREEQPDLVGIPSITATVPAALATARSVKRACPSAQVLVGGVHPTFMAEEMLRDAAGSIDYVVCGEGEKTIEELLRILARDGDPAEVSGIAFLDDGGDLVKTPSRSFLHDLEEYPADFDLPDWSIYRYFVIPDSRLGAVSTSRGCDHTCTFCSQQKFWDRSWRRRQPASVVSEIERLYRVHGVNVILISDEYPTADPDRWEEILDRLIALDLPLYLLMETRAEDIVRDREILEKYRRAGVIHIYVGLEATDQETLDLINKELTTDQSREALRLIREHGMLSETSFVLGFPHETEETIDTTLKLAKHFDPDMAHFLCITTWPYAELWEDMKDRVRVHDYAKYNLIEPVVEPLAMSLADLDAAIVRCYRDFYMGKMHDFVSFPDEFRRHYMLSSMKLIMKSSFLVKKIGHMAMPRSIARRLAGEGAA